MTGVQLFAGTAGTPAIPKGCYIRRVVCIGATNATAQMPDGNGGSVTVPVPSAQQHVLIDDSDGIDTLPFIRSAGSDIVFTSTVSYLVQVYIPSGVSVVS